MSIELLAKQLYQAVNKMGRLPYTSEIKAKYPRFKASNREHWQLLIFKLLSRDAKGNKWVDKEVYNASLRVSGIMNNLSTKLDAMGIKTGKQSSYPISSITFYYGRNLLGEFGYSFITDEFYIKLPNTPKITRKNGENLADRFYQGSVTYIKKAQQEALQRKFKNDKDNLLDTLFQMSFGYELSGDFEEIFSLEFADDMTSEQATYKLRIHEHVYPKSATKAQIITYMQEFLKEACNQSMKATAKSRLRRGYANP